MGRHDCLSSKVVLILTSLKAREEIWTCLHKAREYHLRLSGHFRILFSFSLGFPLLSVLSTILLPHTDFKKSLERLDLNKQWRFCVCMNLGGVGEIQRKSVM